MVLQTAPSGETDPAARLFAKWGLFARAGAVVDLRVAAGWEGHARIGWGQEPLSPGIGVRVPACPRPSGPAQWLGFAGGYWVDQPTCLPLIVSANGEQTRVFISIGLPCTIPTSPRPMPSGSA
jgi:hypothetical protein